MWSDFIKYVFEKLEYNTVPDKSIIDKGKYFLVSNPFVKDCRPSCVVYKKGGLLRLFNADVDGKEKLQIWEWSKMIGVYDDYIAYLCQYYDISYQELLLNKPLCNRFHVRKDSNVNESTDFTVNKLDKLKPVATTECEEVQLSEFERDKAIEYIESLNLSIFDGIKPVGLRIYNDEFETFKTAIAFDYNGTDYVKYRYLVDGKQNRYRAKGRYDKFYIAKYNPNSKKCYVIEGEKESIVFSKYVDDSVYGISGTSIPNCDMLSGFGEIEVLLDLDKFYERCWAVYQKIKEQVKHNNIVIRPKLLIWHNGVYDTTLDYSDFHKHKKLTEEIIKTGIVEINS